MKNRKILVGAVLAILVIILVITGISINLSKKNDKISISTPELARAMTYEQFEEGDEAIDGTDNVKFSAFFLRDLDGDGYAEKIKGTCKPIGEEDTLYMEINVQTEGYLKDAKIEIAGQNFYLQTVLPKDEQLKDNYIGNNIKTIEFNQLNNGTQKLFSGVVRSGDYSNASKKSNAIGKNINNYSRTDNKIILTGIYVAQDGTEIEISKEIELTMDWYGTTRATISGANQTYKDLTNRVDAEEGTIKLGFKVNTNEINQELNLSKNYVGGTIPELNGYAPIAVRMINTSSSNLSFSYNSNTRTFTIERTATIGEDGKITTSLAKDNSYEIEVIYPIEAYQEVGEDIVSIKIPVYTYYEGYNNSNTEFTNPYKSNIASTIMILTYLNPVEAGTKATNFTVTVGKMVYKPIQRNIVSKQKPLNIYNGASEKETNDIYTVRWYAYIGTEEQTTGITMRETKNEETQVVDKFIKTDATEISMENITSNIGIYITGADNLLKEDGWIKVYDEETDNLLATFTKDNWNRYTSSNPYRYELSVKHIRVETSETNVEQGMYVYNIKELDDGYITENFTKEEFDDLQYINSTLNGYVNGEHKKTVTVQANYEEPYSVATIALSNSKISTQGTEENAEIRITATKNENDNELGWRDGNFLVKLPEEILVVEINDVTIGNANVEITSCEIIEEDEGKFIKINTKNNNDITQGYTITIDVDITPDPRLATLTRNIELYASNNEITKYYYEGQDIYDVNDNLNTEEVINKTTTLINLIAPSSLLTNQTASEYDKNNNVTIAPQIAEITPVYAKVDNEKQTAKIGVQIKNNYASTISEVKILGKIPFEGNTTVISEKELQSEFTTKMLDTGIEIPEELEGKVRVYYSENETPDKDLTKIENGWQTADNITNWDNIKTFLIDFEDEVIALGLEYTFYYKIEIPEGVEFNKTTYSHHGVYFCLDTEEGKYRTQTEPNKLGFRIVEKFNLEIIKTQTGKDKTVPGATYSVTEILSDETLGTTRTETTDESGKLVINNLYALRTYEISEIKSPNDYELNSDIIRLIGHVAEDGTLTIEKIQGETKEEIEVSKNEGEKHRVTVRVEDEAKAKLKIIKKEQGTENLVSYVKYKLTGYGLPANGRILTTNANGETSISGLKIGEEYTLEETKASGYYLADPIKFKIVNNEGVYSLEVKEGTVLENSVTEEYNLPIANLVLENEKIPRYTLEIRKIKKILETELETEETEESTTTEQEMTYLQGAKFKLYKDDKEIGEYITDENGKITINDLYQYVDGKDEEAIYTLKEVLAPEGYAKVKDITFKVQNTEGTLELINTNGDEEKYTVEGTTVKLTIEDSPSFRLIKKDAETGEVLANVKFAIYNVDDGTVPAKNSKGEIIGTLEIINRKEYYTVTTDNNGVITADLPEGFYKAEELESPEKYDLENATYYFGIGGSREGKTGLQAEWGKVIGGSSSDYIKSVEETSDGGYIVGGYFHSSSIELGNGIILDNKGSADGILIKYDSERTIEWAKVIGGNALDGIYSVTETSDGGYIVGGSFRSTSIDLENGVRLTTRSSDTIYSDGMIIKYSSNGEVEWGKVIGGTYNDEIYSVEETSDGGCIAVGKFNSNTINLDNNVKLNNNSNNPVNRNLLTDGMIIKFDSKGIAQWAKVIGGSSNDDIKSVEETSDGGYILGGYFESESIDLGNGITLTNNSSNTSYSDGMLIKCDENGNAEWAKSVGGSRDDEINSIIETQDGGYIVVGYFQGDSINLGNEIILSNKSSSVIYSDGMLIKYSSTGEVKWCSVIGGNSNDYIIDVEETRDGGYIVGGDSSSNVIDLGEEVILSGTGILVKYTENGEVEWGKNTYSNEIESIIETQDGGYIIGGNATKDLDLENGITLDNKGSNDGILIKYTPVEVLEIVTEQAQVIGGTASDKIKLVKETSDGGYIIIGDILSTSIDLENGVTLSNKGNNDGILIKYSSKGVIEWAEVIGGSSGDYINSVEETSDGGYIVGGYFKSSSIDLGNGIILSNKGSEDGMLIKYSREGKAEWAKAIGGSSNDRINSIEETLDGGYIVGGYCGSNGIGLGKSIDLGNGVTLKKQGYIEDGILIKYSAEGKAEWAKAIGGDSSDYINSVIETSDGGYIAVGDFFSGSIELGNGVRLKNYKSGIRDAMLIKYTREGEVEWGETISGDSTDQIKSVEETSDRGYIVMGYSFSSNIKLGNGFTLSNNGSNDGILLKYSEEGVVEWAKTIGGSQIDSISSVSETSDGGYIVGGYFASYSIELGNGVILNNHTKSTSFYNDGMLIKYNESGEVEWAKTIGGSDNDQISTVSETRDGGYIVGGYFESSGIGLENGDGLSNNGSDDGILLKYSAEGIVEWAKTIGGSGDDQISIVSETRDGSYIVGGNFYNSSIELENGLTLSNKGNNDGMLIRVAERMGAPEVQELVVENERKEFKITTDIVEIDGIKGGTISGEDEEIYETVKYGDSNTKEVVMIPDENYEIIRITVNGEEYSFTADEDDTYTPVFTNITEDKHIEVTYALKDNRIIINKVDSQTQETLSGATFKLDQIEEREVPESTVGDLTDNGQEYIETDLENEVVDVLGDLTNNGTYYFIEQDGKYVPTNSKTYQVANGGTGGIGNTTANSYIEIDLSEKEGNYVVSINARCYSEKNYDYGYATITESIVAPTYSSSTGQFIKVAGITTAQDYESNALLGGKKYYLHLGYRKDGSGNTGEDQIVFNSIKVYKTKTVTYGFIENEGKYESTIQGKHNRIANSYMPIDLTNCEGTYNLIVNANVSSATGDYGYVTITENTNRPAYSSSTGRLIYITGTTTAVITPTDYTTVLEGGKLYYLHLGYYKNSSISSGDDKFTVNSITITPNAEDLYHTEVTTNSAGQGITQIPFGKYAVTETVAPVGYELNENSVVVEFRADGTHEFTLENNKLAKVIVHHYIKGTETKVAEDEILQDKAGYPYITEPQLDIKGYNLEKDENGNYIMPENARGQFISGEQEVIYYYELKPIPLTVNYYIEGTETSVELNDGSVAESITEAGDTGEKYTTSELENVSEKYELVEIPTNANGTYGEEEVIVTYYYRIKTYNITTRVEEQVETTVTGQTSVVKGGSITGEGETPYEVVKHGENTTKQIEIIPADDVHKISRITINGIEQEFTENEDGTVILELFENVTENKEIVVTFERVPTKLIVHHYITGTTNRVLLSSGGEALDEEYDMRYGENYETSNISRSELDIHYELDVVPNNAEGIVGDEKIVVIYYYKIKDYDLELTKYEEETDKVLSGVSFGVTEVLTGESKEYTTDENGKILAQGLVLGQTYEIKETNTVDGYLLKEEPIIITTDIVDGKIEVTVLEGEFKETEDEIIVENAGGDNAVVKVSLENEPILTLIKKGDKGDNLLPGVKFVIKEIIEEGGQIVEKPATDYYGNLVGIEEEINDKVERVVTTDENGEINEALKVGKYRITEVQTLENYVIDEQNTYEFEVKRNQPRIYEINKKWEGSLYGYDIVKLKDGSYISIADIDPTLTILAEDTVNNEEIQLTDVYDSCDIAIIKYNKNLKVESVRQIGGTDWDSGQEVIATTDGGFIVSGLLAGEISIENGEVKISDEDSSTWVAVIIKYNAQGNAEWIMKTESRYTIYSNIIENSQGNFIIHGYAYAGATIPAEETVDNEEITIEIGQHYIMELTKQGKVKWITNLSGNYSYNDTKIYELKNGNYIMAPEMYSYPVYFEISSIDGTVIQELNVEDIGNAFDFNKIIEVYDVQLSSDGGIVFIGYIGENQTIGAEYTASGKEIELDTHGANEQGFIVKFNNELKVEWAHTLNASSSVYERILVDANGEYIVFGMYADNIVISEDETVNNDIINISTNQNDAFVIKYNSQGKVKCAQGISMDNYYDNPRIISEGEYLIYIDDELTIYKEKFQEATQAEKVQLEIINTYSGPENEIVNTLEKTGTDKVTSKDTKIYYEVKYNGTIDYFVGNARLTIVDTLPYPIIVEESEIAGGTYDAETKTITWTEELNNLNTFQTGEVKSIATTKILNLKYDYGNINDITEKLENKVNSTLELLEASEENSEEYVVVKEDKQEVIAETLVEIPTEVKVHHYIYDAEKNEYTTVKLAEDEVIEGIIGQGYTTGPSENVARNYIPINTTPENYEGKMTEEVIEVTYYYQLATPVIENDMNKVGTANKEDNNGVAVLTREDGVVTYNIKYNVTIKDYIGKTTIEIVDTLPAAIDITKSDIAGGIYDITTNTIKWNDTIEGIDTYANGEYVSNITKEIKVVYVNEDVTNYLVNTVVGNVKLYYPESHTTKPGEELAINTARDNEAVGQEYKVNLSVEKVWEDNEDLKGKRPDSVTIVIKGKSNEEVREEILNAENEWKCEIIDLPKYDAEGNKIIYEVTEKETTVGELEYYEEPVISKIETQTDEVTNYVFTVKNAFKLLDTDLKAQITKEGTKEITSSTQEVEYTINFKAEVIDYIGEGKVKIVDTLPYKIDEELSDLSEGVYDDEKQTITWEEELPHINTDVSRESYKVDITKNIKVVYKEIDLTTLIMTNKVNGRIELYETESKDEKETTYDTNVNVDGKVIVRYVDKDTGEDIDIGLNYEIVDKVGTEYETEQKEIENYDYIEATDNKNGIIAEETQEVIYYYSRIKTSVIVKYQDTEGNELLEDVLINGQVGDEYSTEQKEIENYRFVEVTDNKEGIMTKEQIVVIYVYEKIQGKVKVRHLEKDLETGEEKEILPTETIEGYAGDEYITERKVIPNYRKAEPEPENKTGKMTEEEIEVKYYYEKIPSGIITVKYVDIETEEEITYKETKEDGTEEEKTYRYEIKGYVGEEYKTEGKEIPYYVFVNATENTEGKLSENSDTVIYYYRKQIFNFSVEKTITDIILNGTEQKAINNKLMKVEVKTSEIENTEIVVRYSIKVKNTGEIRGIAEIIETIPEGYKLISEKDNWRKENGNLVIEVELEAGEEKELIIELEWLNSENNLGLRENRAQIIGTENDANYEETVEEDNISIASMIVTIKTGEEVHAMIIILLTSSLAICLYMQILLIIDIRKEPGQDIREIKFLKRK